MEARSAAPIDFRVPAGYNRPTMIVSQPHMRMTCSNRLMPRVQRMDQPHELKVERAPRGWRCIVMGWAGPLVGIGLLAASVGGVEWAALGAALSRIDPVWSALAIASVLCTILAKALRWRDLCGAGATPIGPFLDGILVGQAANIVFPGRVGDLARITMLGRRKEMGYSVALGSLFAEKGMDGLMLVALLVAFLPFNPGIGSLDTRTALLMAALAAGVLVLCLWILRQERVHIALAALVGRLAGRRGAAWAGALRSSLTRMSSVTLRSWKAWLWTVSIWGLGAWTNQLLFIALDLRLDWSAAPLLLVVLQLGWLVRITPGQIGIVQYLTILTLDAYQVDQALALACGLLLNLMVIAPPLVLCVWALRHEGLHWVDLSGAIRRPPGGPEAEREPAGANGAGP
jgi:glycosyltransferase 2 family protein